MGLAEPAQARDERRQHYFVASQRTPDALISLAVQARVPLGGEVARCSGRSPRISGAMSLDEALRRLLSRSNCAYVIRPSGAVIVRIAAPGSPRVRTPAPSLPPSAAPPPPPVMEDSVEVEEVVVTASRRPETLQTAVQSISAVRGDMLRTSGIAETSDLAAHVAGMNVTNLGPGRNKVFLRGLSDGAFTGLTQSTVAVYLERAPLNYTAPDPDLKLVDLDRVEVLRGPQGALYGTGPIGGVLRIMPNRPSLDDNTVEMSFTRSQTRSGGENQDDWAVLNLAAPNGRAAMRAVAYQESFSGYISDVELNLRSINEGARSGGRVTARLEVAPGWELAAGAVGQTIRTEDTHYVYRGQGRLLRANLVREPHHNRFEHLFGRLRGHGDWGWLNASLAVVQHRFDSRYDASTALRRFGSRALAGAFDEDKDIRLIYGEAVLSSPADRRLHWSVGGFASSARTRSGAALSVLRPTVEVRLYGENRRDHMAETGVFGELAYDLSDILTVTGGGRVFLVEHETWSRVSQRGARRDFDGAAEARGFAPRFALAWRPSDGFTLSAQLSKGQRSGGFNTAGQIGQTFGSSPSGPGQAYASDSLWTLEVGAKSALLDGRAQLRGAVFASRWRDVQSDQFLADGLAYVANVGDAEAFGLEAEGVWRPTAGLELHGNLMMTDTKLVRSGPALGGSALAGGLPFVPDRTASLFGVWRTPLTARWSGVVEGGFSYVGASGLTFERAPALQQGDYVVGRASVGVEGETWSARLFVDNVLDERANTFAYSDPFRLREAQATTPLRPRTIGLTLSAKR